MRGPPPCNDLFETHVCLPSMVQLRSVHQSRARLSFALCLNFFVFLERPETSTFFFLQHVPLTFQKPSADFFSPLALAVSQLSPVVFLKASQAQSGWPCGFYGSKQLSLIDDVVPRLAATPGLFCNFVFFLCKLSSVRLPFFPGGRLRTFCPCYVSCHYPTLFSISPPRVSGADAGWPRKPPHPLPPIRRLPLLGLPRNGGRFSQPFDFCSIDLFVLSLGKSTSMS